MRRQGGRGVSQVGAPRVSVPGVLVATVCGVLAGTLGANGMGAAAVAASDSASSATVSVPVLGRTTIAAEREADAAQAVALVHGVRRIPGGTVLYYSMGVPAGSPPFHRFSFVTTKGLNARFRSSSTPLGAQQVLDPVNHRVYATLIDGNETALASPAEAFGEEAGTMYVYYQVLPELPASTTTVDVVLGHRDVVPAVPVESGLLEPAAEQTGPMELGEAWPKIDLHAVAGSVRPEQAVYSWTTTLSDLERSVVTREAPGEVTVDLAADVLFDVGEATLAARAKGTVREAAEIVNGRAAAGTVTIVGHTDSDGSDPYNTALSRRRAVAVRRALAPLVTTGDVRYDVAGRGERDPVERNTTRQGRQANRRVSITFVPETGA